MSTWKSKTEFKQRVLHYANEMDVQVQWIAVRPMRHKWASCSTKGHLHFNKALLQIDRQLGEYVIVHELLHFNVTNHGKLWKSLMTAYLGDWKALEERLKREAKHINQTQANERK